MGKCPEAYFTLCIVIVILFEHLKGGAYSGVPKLIVETLSPSTAKKDRSEKMEIYEAAGVEEYWIVSPRGSVEIYYAADAISIHPFLRILYHDNTMNKRVIVNDKLFCRLL